MRGMNNVYILIEDDAVLGVFSSRQLAERHAKKISGGLDIRDWTMGRIEEHGVDEHVAQFETQNEALPNKSRLPNKPEFCPTSPIRPRLP